MSQRFAGPGWAAAHGWRGTALPECTTNFLSSPLVLVPPGIPSSHCSSFVYRKPDTNEITAGTSGSKFPQAHAVLVAFALPPHFSGSGRLLNCFSAPALGFWGKEEQEGQNTTRYSPGCWAQPKWKWPSQGPD